MAMGQLFGGVSHCVLKGSGLRPKGSLNSPSIRFDEGARGELCLHGLFRARREGGEASNGWPKAGVVILNFEF